MKKNNKGFFLAETIVVIALVTTVMAFVFPNVTKLYENYKNRTNYYDQTEDLYVLRAYSKLYSDDIQSLTTGTCAGYPGTEVGVKNLSDLERITTRDNFGDLNELYISGYMSELSKPSNYNFNRYLKRLKKTTYDSASYRLIGVFEDGSTTRYASIKIENPNPNRHCNLGG